MLQTALYSMSQARALLDDQPGSFATNAYLAPFLQIAQDELVANVLKNPELGQLATVVVLPAVSSGTTNLTNHFQPGGALELLAAPISIKERAVTDTANENGWVWMDPARDLPTFTPGALNHFYSWDGSTIKFPGADQSLDIRIYGKFEPQTIVTQDSPIVPGTSIILSFRAAGIVALSRGNDSLASTYENRALAAQQSFVADAIMELQALRTRFRPFSGRTRLS